MNGYYCLRGKYLSPQYKITLENARKQAIYCSSTLT